MAAGCEKITTKESPHPRNLSSCLPHEFQKERPFEKKVSRILSDPVATKVQEILYEKIPTSSEMDKEFIPHMKALKRIQDEFQSFLGAKAKQVPVGQVVSQILVHQRIFIQIPFEEAKREKIGEIYKISLIYNAWKQSVTQSVESISSESLKQECFQFEDRINGVLKFIDKSLDDLHGCYNFEELMKQYQKFAETFICHDHIINEMKKDIELEEVIAFDKGVLNAIYSRSARLCNLLGLELDVLRELFEEKRILDYYSLQRSILMSLENSYRYIEDENKFELSVEGLQNLGFAKYFAENLVDAIPTEMRSHLSTIEWIKIYIQSQFKYNVFLAPEYPNRFPFGKEETKKWFTLKDGETSSATSNCNITNVSLINLESQNDDSFKLQNKNEFPNSLKDEEHIVLFHGTDHLSATDILFEGIDLRKGGRECDFSHEKGFYLTDNFKKAVDWSFHRPKSKPAVLVYRVKIAWLRNDRKFIDFCNYDSVDGLDWKKVVLHNITGAKDKKIRKKLNTYDFVEGPISTVPRPVNQNKYKHPSPEPGTYQICLNSEDFAEEFGQRIHSILFFDK